MTRNPWLENGEGMVKLLEFSGTGPSGEPLIHLLHPTKSGLIKTAAPLHPEVQSYMSSVAPDDNFIYILVVALGSGEYYGQNINGDYFPWSALRHSFNSPEGKFLRYPFGYETFNGSGYFVHHQNKDFERRLGVVTKSILNEGMKRIDLVIQVDKTRCREMGAEDLIERLEAGDRTDVSMGCLRAGSPILLENGSYKPIDLIQEGDRVFTHLGSGSPVTSVMQRDYSGRLITFHLEGVPDFSVTEEHPVLILRHSSLVCRPERDNRWPIQHICAPEFRDVKKGCTGCTRSWVPEVEFVPASEVSEDDHLLTPVPEERDTPLTLDEMEFLGYYTAEGYCRNYAGDTCGRGVELCLGIHEDIFEQKITSCAEKIQGDNRLLVYSSLHPASNGKRVDVYNNRIHDLCLEHVGSSGAKNKSLSLDILHAPAEKTLAFLRAYHLGDGGVYRGSVYFSTASVTLAHQLVLLLAKVGIVSSLNTLFHGPSTVVDKDTVEYQIWVGTDHSWKLGIEGTRKSFRACSRRLIFDWNGKKYLSTPLESIEEEEINEKVFNFSVQGAESYVAGLVAVHNCRVPFDLCRITTDWDLYDQAYNTYNPSVHAHVAEAIIAFHKAKKAKDGIGIPGLSITRADYSDYCRNQMGKILPDGRQVGVINTFPRFFDISDVVIRADRIAKQMTVLNAEEGEKVASIITISSAMLGEEEMMKAASAELQGLEQRGQNFKSQMLTASNQSPTTKTELKKYEKSYFKGEDDSYKEWLSLFEEAHPGLKIQEKTSALKTSALRKVADILKEIPPDQVTGKMLAALEPREESIPRGVLNEMSEYGVQKALSSSGLLGIPLKPHEFQRIILVSSGLPGVADKLDDAGITFPVGHPGLGSSLLDHGSVEQYLKALLLPYLSARSVYAPPLARRIITISIRMPQEEAARKEVDEPPLDKISSLYTDYRKQLWSMLAGEEPKLCKLASADPDVWSSAMEPWGGLAKNAEYRLPLMALAAPLILAHLYSNKVQEDQALKGIEPSAASDLIATYPTASGLVGSGLLYQLAKNMRRG